MTTKHTPSQLLTTQEAAEELRVRPNTVLRWCRSGKLRASKLGKEWRIPRSAIAAFLRSRSNNIELWDLLIGRNR